MENIKAKYIDFKHRLFVSSGFFWGLIMFVVLEIMILNKWGLNLNYSLIYQICLITLLLLFFNISIRKSKYYIDTINFKEQSIIISVYQYDKRLDNIEINYSELIAELKKNLYERYPRYTLKLKSRNSKFKIGDNYVFIQYEIGFWNKKNLKKVYEKISLKQSK